ncbi:MAG: hypothetical protein KKD18_06595, partial [Nanoarchaeota archaeon]|nr:hypothetical protein [Nanoarchaeota archaeon]
SGWGQDTCGYQERGCIDIKECGHAFLKPVELQACFYTKQPNCFDGIKNCHDGSCEFLADCGGPCEPCPSCSDGVQNQGEGGVDCGGPCPTRCEREAPSEPQRLSVIYIFITLILLAILGIKLYQTLKVIGPSWMKR